jgi:hypothetical protein
MWKIGWAANSIPIYSYIQQDATLHTLFITENFSTCFGWYFHPSSGAHTAVSTALAICHTVTFICRSECAVGGVRQPQYTQTGSNSSTIAADSSNGVTKPDAVDTVVCAPDDGWKYHPKHVEQFPDINKMCNIASCWIYIGIYLQRTDP